VPVQRDAADRISTVIWPVQKPVGTETQPKLQRRVAK